MNENKNCYENDSTTINDISLSPNQGILSFLEPKTCLDKKFDFKKANGIEFVSRTVKSNSFSREEKYGVIVKDFIEKNSTLENALNDILLHAENILNEHIEPGINEVDFGGYKITSIKLYDNKMYFNLSKAEELKIRDFEFQKQKALQNSTEFREKCPFEINFEHRIKKI